MRTGIANAEWSAIFKMKYVDWYLLCFVLFSLCVVFLCLAWLHYCTNSPFDLVQWPSCFSGHSSIAVRTSFFDISPTVRTRARFEDSIFGCRVEQAITSRKDHSQYSHGFRSDVLCGYRTSAEQSFALSSCSAGCKFYWWNEKQKSTFFLRLNLRHLLDTISNFQLFQCFFNVRLNLIQSRGLAIMAFMCMEYMSTLLADGRRGSNTDIVKKTVQLGRNGGSRFKSR